MRRSLFAGLVLAVAGQQAAMAQTTNSGTDKFAQLETMLPTPNSYRTASGAPGSDSPLPSNPFSLSASSISCVGR